jgi:hypothetical protein
VVCSGGQRRLSRAEKDGVGPPTVQRIFELVQLESDDPDIRK